MTYQPIPSRQQILRRLLVGSLALAAAGSLWAADPAPATDPAAPVAGTPDAPPPAPKWERSASVGFTLTRGNSKTILATANAVALRKWDKNEITLGADGAYGEDDGEKNTESIRGYAQYNRLFTERFYGLLRAEALHDGVADVEYRVTLSPGVGYYLIKNAKTKLSFEIGPGFILEKLGHEESQYVTLRLAERFEQKLSDRARLWQSLEFLPQVDRFENYILNAEIGMDADITKTLALTTFLQDTYDSEPAPGRKQNDLRWVTGLKLKF